MDLLRLILLGSFATLFCATSVDHTAEDGGANTTDRRSDLELYVYQLTSLIDTQIDEIATMIPESEVVKFRSEHYTWKTERDIRCAEIGRTEPGALREFECLAELGEHYFERREAVISDLETLQGKTNPTTTNQAIP